MRRVALMLVILILSFSPARGQEQQTAEPEVEEWFSFYGLQFGMTPEEVQAVFHTDKPVTMAIKPGHGMMHLSFTFDFRERLSEIRAAYELAPDPYHDEALRLALREKFIQPVSARWPEVSVSIDQYSNRAALTLTFISLDLREESINHFKEEYLKKME